MSKLKDAFNVESSLNQLSFRFNEIYGMYHDDQGEMQKNIYENQQMLSRQGTLSSDLYHNFIKEHNRLENNQRTIASTKKSFMEELQELQHRLLGNADNSDGSKDPISELRQQIESNVKILNDKIFKMIDRGYIEKAKKEQISRYFEENAHHNELSFANAKKLLSVKTQGIDFAKIEALTSANLLTLDGIEVNIEQMQKRIDRALTETENLNTLYKQEKGVLEESLQLIKQKLMSSKKSQSRDGRHGSPLYVNDSYSANKQRFSETLEPLSLQAITTNMQKDQLFESTTKELSKAYEKMKRSTSELILHADSLKSNQQLLASILQKNTPKSSPSKKATPEKFNLLASWAHHDSTPQISTQYTQSPIHLSMGPGNMLRSPSKIDVAKSFNFEEHRTPKATESRRGNEDKTDRDLANCLAKIKDYERFSESMSQKMTQLKANVSNFMVTCERMVKISSETTEAESYMIQSFDNEKQQLENHVYGLSEFIVLNKNKLRLSELRSPDKLGALSPLQKLIRERAQTPQSLNQSKRPSGVLHRNTVEDLRNSRATKTLLADEPISSSVLRSNSKINLSTEHRYSAKKESTQSKFKIWSLESSVEPRRDNASVDVLLQDIAPFDETNLRGSQKRGLAVEIDSNVNQNIKNKELVRSLLMKTEDLSQENMRILRDNQLLIKANKKLDVKAADRKRTLKELYALVTEKDKELNFYRSNFMLGLNKSETSEAVEVTEASAKIDQNETEMLEKYKQLEAKLDVKGAEIDKLTSMVINLSNQKTIPEKKDFVLNISPITAKSRRFEDMDSTNRSKPSDRHRLDILIEQTKELDRKREMVENIIHELSGDSPSKVKELNSMITLLKKEKEQAVDKIKGLRAYTGSPKAESTTKFGGKDYSINLRDDKPSQLDVSIEQPDTGINYTEPTSGQFAKQISLIHDYERVIEQPNRNEIDLLNDKVEKINTYIQDLENKKNETIKESLSPQKLLLLHAGQRLQVETDDFNVQVQDQIMVLTAKTNEILDYLKVDKELFEELDFESKLEAILDKIKDFHEKEKPSSFGNIQNSKDQIISSKEDYIQRLEQDIRKYRKSNDELLEKIASEKVDKNRLSLCVREAQDKINYLVEKYSFLNTSNNFGDETTIVRFLESLESTLDETSEYLQTRKSGLRSRGDESPSFEKSPNNETERRQLRRKLEDLNQNYEKLLGENAELQENLRMLQGSQQILNVTTDRETSVVHQTVEVDAREETQRIVTELTQKLKENEDQMKMLKQDLIEKQHQYDRVQELANSREELLNEKDSELTRQNEKFIKDLEQSNVRHSEEISRLELQINDLNKEIESLKSKLLTTQTDLENSGKDLLKASQNSERIQTTLNENMQTIEIQKARISLLEKQNDSNLEIVNKEKLNLAHETSILRDQISILRQDIIKAQSTNHDLTVKINGLTSDLELSKKSIQSSSRKNTEIESEAQIIKENSIKSEQNFKQTIEQLQKEKNTLDEEKRVIQDQVYSSKAMIKSLEDRLLHQNELNQTEVRSLKNINAEHLLEIQSLQDNTNSLKRNIEELKTQFVDLKQKISLLENTNEKLATEKNLMLTEKMLFNKESSIALEEAKDNFLNSERLLSKEKNKVAKLEEKVQEIKQLQEKTAGEFDGQLSSLQTLLDKKEQERKNLVRNLDTLKRESSRVEEELKSQIKSLQDKMMEEKNKLSTDYETRHRSTLDQSNAQLNKLEEAEASLKGLESANTSLKDMCGALERKVEEALNKNIELQETNEKLKAELEAVKTEIENLQEENALASQRRKASEERCTALGEEAKIMQKNLKDLISKMEEAKTQAAANLKTKKVLEEEKLKLEEKVKELVFRYNNLEHEKEKCVKELNIFKQSLENLDRDDDEIVQSGGPDHQEKFAKYRGLIDEAKINQKRIQLLESEIESMKTTTKTKEEELLANINSGRNKVEDLKNEHSKLLEQGKIHNQNLRNDLEDLQNQLQTLKNDHEKQSQTLKQSEIEKSQMQQKIKEYTAEALKYAERLKLEETKNKEFINLFAEIEVKASKSEDQKREFEKRAKTYQEAEELAKRDKAELEKKLESYVSTNRSVMEKQEAVCQERDLLLKENEDLKKIVKDSQPKTITRNNTEQADASTRDPNTDQLKLLEAEYIQKKEGLNQAMNDLKEETKFRLNAIAEETKEIVEFLFNESFDISAMSSMYEDSFQVEQRIHNYLAIIKRKAQEQTEKYTSRISLDSKGREDVRLDDKSGRLAQIVQVTQMSDRTSKELTKKLETIQDAKEVTDTEEAKEVSAIELGDQTKDMASILRDPSFSMQDENYEGKDYGSAGLRVTDDIKKTDKSMLMEQEQVRMLYEQVRELQDGKDKLEMENKKLKTSYEMLGFEIEDLKAEIRDKDEENNKITQQLEKLREELSRGGGKSRSRDVSPIAHEKQHIRTMLIKFLQSAMNAQKDAEELLKLLLSLLELDENTKRETLTQFKARNAKKGVFSKLF